MTVARPAIIALLAAAAPALAAPPARPAVPPLQIAQSSDVVSKRVVYEDDARREMELWRQRLSKAGAEAQEKGAHLAESAQQELDRAWTALQADWAAMQRARGETWDDARIAFEHAADRMKDEWRKFHPNDE